MKYECIIENIPIGVPMPYGVSICEEEFSFEAENDEYARRKADELAKSSAKNARVKNLHRIVRVKL